MKVEEMITFVHSGSKVSVRLEINGNFTQTPYLQPAQVPSMVCRLLATKMNDLVKQRQWQVSRGYYNAAKESLDELTAAISRVKYRLSVRNQWRCANIKNYISAALPDLRTLSASATKHSESWRQFIICLELFLQEDDIERKIRSLLEDSDLSQAG